MGIIIFLLIISLSRYAWALLLVPLLILLFPKTLWKQVLAIVFASALIIGIYWVFSKISSPGLSYIQAIAARFQVSIGTGIKGLLRQIGINFHNLFIREYNLPVVVGFRFNFVILIVLVIIQLVRTIKRKWGRVIKNGVIDNVLSTYSFVLISVLSLVAVAFSSYFIIAVSDFRLFAPIILLSVLLIIQLKQYKPVIVFNILNLLLLPFFISAYKDFWSYNYFYDQNQVEEMRLAIENRVQYNPETQNQWCNTIFIPISFYDYRVTQIPAGIGVSYYIDYDDSWGEPHLPLRSRYVWLNEETYLQLNHLGPLNLQELGDTPSGTLYLNLDAQCP